MATASVPLTTPRPAAVADVLARSSRWVRGTRKSDGRPFFVIPSSRGSTVYYADRSACTCPDARERGRICKHSLAVQQFQARQDPLTDVTHDELVDAAHEYQIEQAFADVARCRACGERTTDGPFCRGCRRRLLSLDDD
jgi:SWIM zinc finger